MLRKIADTFIIIPLGENVIEFNGLLTLSESGALLWDKLESDASYDDLVSTLLSEYNVEESVARLDIDDFITELDRKGLIQ
jgi:hypothetical protein